MPIDWLSNYRFSSNEFVQTVDCHIFILHGKKDKVIPYDSTEKLFETIPNPNKTLFTIEEGGNTYLQDFHVFKDGMNEALD